MGERKVPRWTVAFLRALERTGEVRTAAEDAGVDHSTAYARRRTHAEFAAAWGNALRLRSGRAAEEERRSLDKFRTNGSKCNPSTIASSGNGPPPRAELREELLGTAAFGGAQVKRVGEGRWSQAKEAAFFDELAATANVKRAAAAAGVSANAVYARRMKQPLFRAKWAAVLETGRAAIEMKLVEAANKSFDADDIDTGEVEPKVSVAEAIKIVQIHGSKTQHLAIAEIEPPAGEIEEVRERLFNKLERLRKRETARCLAEGWTLDESYDHLVPPGWIRGPDYRPKPPEPPEDRDALYR